MFSELLVVLKLGESFLLLKEIPAGKCVGLDCVPITDVYFYFFNYKKQSFAGALQKIP